jgi:PAS domain S-box-containing protein
MKRRSRGLANYIGVGSLYLILIPLVLMGVWSAWIFNAAIKRSIASATETSAGAVAGRLEEFLARPQFALLRIETIIKRQDLYARGKINDYLADALSIYPFLGHIEVIGPEGRVEWLAPYDAAFTGVSRRGETVYERVRNSSDIEWSASYISLQNNAPGVSIGQRIGDYVVLCDLDLSAIERFSVPSRETGTARYAVSITDGNGVYLSDRDASRVRRREQCPAFAQMRKGAIAGGAFEVLERGDRHLASVSRLGAPPWYVMVLYPMSELNALLRAYYTGFLSILVLAAGLGLAISRIRVRRIARALQDISTKAARISRGEYSELREFGEGFSEFEKVGENFNGMVAGIKSREGALLHRERGFRRVLEDIRLFALGFDGEGRISFANTCFLEVFGYSRVELYGKEFSCLQPEGSRPERSPFGLPASGANSGDFFECSIAARNGEQRLVEWTVTANYDDAGASSGMTGIGTDITESRSQRRLLESSLTEKEVLLREVHHRVKNNLQLISSLLSLQKGESREGLADSRLDNAQKRIRSISLVHEMLYDTDNLGAIDFGEYALALARETLQGRKGREISLVPRIEPIHISLNEAIPCGLILNEALTNVRKYAFPDWWEGEPVVELSIRLEESGFVLIRVADCGVGMPGECDPAAACPTLGLTIMRLLAAQVGASIDIHSDGGTRVELSLARQSPPSRT